MMRRRASAMRLASLVGWLADRCARVGMLNGAPVSAAAFLGGNLLPVTLGNILGGGLFVAGAAWYAHGRK